MPDPTKESGFHSIPELPIGSLVVERYIYTNRNGNDGVQWLAEIVDKDGDLALFRACRTRREALELLLGHPDA